MTQLPTWLLCHTVTVEPYLGESAYGPRYGDPVAAAVLVAETVKRVRNATGAEVVSTAQVYGAPELYCPVGSRVILPDGRITTALTAAHHTAPGVPVPESSEVYCE